MNAIIRKSGTPISTYSKFCIDESKSIGCQTKYQNIITEYQLFSLLETFKLC